FDNSGKPGIAITNFDNEMIGLYRAGAPGVFDDVSIASGVGAPSRTTLGFGCMFLDVDLDGALDLAVANGHIDETVRNIRGNVGYAQPPQLFLNEGHGKFRDVAAEAGGGFDQPRVGRGLAYGDLDRDGDLRSEEHTSELQSRGHLVCRLLLEKKKTKVRDTRDEH